MAAKPKEKTCIICGTHFLPWRTTQKVCNTFDCSLEYKKLQKVKSLTHQKRTEKRARVFSAKSWSRLNQEAQTAFNYYIRVRDEGRNCHACGCLLNNNDTRRAGSFVDASHYRSRGSAGHLRFNVFNCVTCCQHCNRERSGNIVRLRQGLIRRFGKPIVARLEKDHSQRRFDSSYLRRIKTVFNRRADHLLKLRSGQAS